MDYWVKKGYEDLGKIAIYFRDEPLIIHIIIHLGLRYSSDQNREWQVYFLNETKFIYFIRDLGIHWLYGISKKIYSGAHLYYLTGLVGGYLALDPNKGDARNYFSGDSAFSYVLTDFILESLNAGLEDVLEYFVGHFPALFTKKRSGGESLPHFSNFANLIVPFAESWDDKALRYWVSCFLRYLKSEDEVKELHELNNFLERLDGLVRTLPEQRRKIIIEVKENIVRFTKTLNK